MHAPIKYFEKGLSFAADGTSVELSADLPRALEALEAWSPGAGADWTRFLGTCAGMILLADDVLDGRSDQRSFAAIDVDVRRNAFGRQVDSFETTLSVDGAPFDAVFIRAPFVERAGDDVEVLASVDGRLFVAQPSPSGRLTAPGSSPGCPDRSAAAPPWTDRSSCRRSW